MSRILFNIPKERARVSGVKSILLSFLVFLNFSALFYSFLSYTSGRRIRRAFSCLRFGTRRTGRRRYRYHREETDAVDDARNANTRQMCAPKGK